MAMTDRIDPSTAVFFLVFVGQLLYVHTYTTGKTGPGLSYHEKEGRLALVVEFLDRQPRILAT